ncbi:putative P-loop ATPase [Bartonella japonica]|uniref:P-loop ATPase n=1 Tax=Bartonella japonica TaxID=357761 RepID=A0ABV2FMD9_9HYPH
MRNIDKDITTACGINVRIFIIWYYELTRKVDEILVLVGRKKSLSDVFVDWLGKLEYLMSLKNKALWL